MPRFDVVNGTGELGLLLLSYRGKPCSHHVVSTDYMLCSHLRRVFSPDRRVTHLACENVVRLRTTDYMDGRGTNEAGRSPTQE